jgi:hypothetical protein
MMASPLLPAPAEDPVAHNQFSLVSCVWLKIIQLPLLPDRNREFSELQVLDTPTPHIRGQS